MEGKRKLLFHGLVQLLITVLSGIGIMDSDAYAQITGYNVAAFGAGNGLEHIGRGLGRTNSGAIAGILRELNGTQDPPPTTENTDGISTAD